MFAIVAETYQFVIGVDTHAKKHVAAVMNNLGVVVAAREVRVTHKQLIQFVDWAQKITRGNVLFAIEGTSSYGETLTNILLARDIPVAEVKPPKTKSRGGGGKTDRIDAELAALSVLRLPVDKLAMPRRGDERKNLRVLLGVRRLLIAQQTMNKNALIALLRGSDLGVDARTPLTPMKHQSIAAWRTVRHGTNLVTRREAKQLAMRILASAQEIENNKQQLYAAVSRLTPDLLELPGIGPVTLAQILCAYSHKGRIRSAEAFAALAGTTPIPASSGNTVHYRLNRYGDRQLNHALHTIVIARMRTDEVTKRYVAKRTQDGLNARDIRRSLKRYVARRLFKQLEAYDIGG